MILDRKHALQQKLFREFAETEFTKELQDELDETGEFNWDMHKKMARYGFMGVKIPEEYGGAGADSLTYVLMDEEFARQDAVLAIYGKYIKFARRRTSSARRKRVSEKGIFTTGCKR